MEVKVFFIKYEIYSKKAFDVDRYLIWVLSICESVREKFEEILPRLDRLCDVVSGAWELKNNWLKDLERTGVEMFQKVLFKTYNLALNKIFNFFETEKWQ